VYTRVCVIGSRVHQLTFPDPTDLLTRLTL